MGTVSVSSCRCIFVCSVHPVAVLNAAFCMTCSLLRLVLLLLFATTRSVFKSVKVSVVEIAKRTN